MRRLLLIVLLVWCASVCGAGEVAGSGAYLEWSELPELPPAPGMKTQVGVAGPFAGVHENALLIAGGANFPERPPWLGGKKVWWPHVYVLQKQDGGCKWLTDESYKLPRPLAYGVSMSLPEGVLCIGGCDAEKSYRDVFLLKWHPEAKKVALEEWPSLPEPLSFMAGAKLGDCVYLAGGKTDAASTHAFLVLDLSKKNDPEQFKWKKLDPWPGPPRMLPLLVAQSDGADNCLYLFSGRNEQPGQDTELLTDAYCFNPKSCERETGGDKAASPGWKRIAHVGTNREQGKPVCVTAGTAIASGTSHVLVFGGDRGDLFMKLFRLGKDASAYRAEAERRSDPEEKAKSLARAEAVEKEIRLTQDSHPGFCPDVLAYHTITDTWTKIGELPTSSHVTTTALDWDGSIVIPTGEIRPGVRTPKIWRAEPVKPGAFGLVNYAVLAAYLLALVGMGAYFAKREKSTEDFFKAGKRIPWWAAGLSIYGTQLSAITFMAIPAKTFATDWRYFTGSMAIVMVAPIIIMVFLPFFRRLDVTTAYEYLERRFNLVTRLCGSVMFVILQLGRIGIVLFLPAIALSVVTGINVRLCIVAMAVLSIAYTVMGGIEAVIWTDVLQVVVLLGGALLCLVLVVVNLDGGVSGLLAAAGDADKLRLFDFTPSLVTQTFWVVLLGGLAANLISYGSDQTVIQRYLTTKDEKSAARGIWTNALLCIPGSVLFFAMGTALFVFFKSNPRLMNPTLGNADAIFPWYIVTQLPQGVAGLVIAGVFAAAMSSLDSSMNSVATAVTTDFYRRFKPTASDHSCLNLARGLTIVVGALGMAFAILMTYWDVKSLWDMLSKVIGLFAGGLGGVFLLGILTRRANGAGAIIGLLASGCAQFFVAKHTDLYLLLYSFTGMVSCIVIGYLASLAMPSGSKAIEGLTIHTIGREAGNRQS